MMSRRMKLELLQCTSLFVEPLLAPEVPTASSYV
jgi:hypothetical protein